MKVPLLGFPKQTHGHIGRMEKSMEATITGYIGVYWGYVGYIGVYWGYVGIMARKMEATIIYQIIQGLYRGYSYLRSQNVWLAAARLLWQGGFLQKPCEQLLKSRLTCASALGWEKKHHN